jgi:hypothetical protein
MTLSELRAEAIRLAPRRTGYDLRGCIESLGVLKTVEQIEDFWRPPVVKRIILAESHVYSYEVELRSLLLDERWLSQISEFRHTMGIAVKGGTTSALPSFPRKYVRFICGLSYGEEERLEKRPGASRTAIAKTGKFWKLFALATESEEGVHGNRDRGGLQEARLRHHLHIMNSLYNRGYWLLQASRFGLYVPTAPEGDRTWQGQWIARLAGRQFNRGSYEEILVRLSRAQLAERLNDLNAEGRLNLERVYLLGRLAKLAWLEVGSPLSGFFDHPTVLGHPAKWRKTDWLFWQKTNQVHWSATPELSSPDVTAGWLENHEGRN